MLAPASATILLIRHGHTVGNQAGPEIRMSGWADLPLSDLGRLQVELLRRRLAAAGERFAAIYASPLARARDTAWALVAAALGPLIVCPELREINCGLVDGRPVDQIQREYPEQWAANLRQQDDDFRWPGGESYREFRGRCLDALAAIARRHVGERVAVVTHAGVISQVLGAAAGSPAARWEDRRPENCALTEVGWRDGAGVLRSFNDHAHLGRGVA